MKPLPKLTPVQQKLFEAELSGIISAPRWFVIFGTLEDDCTDDCGAGDPQLAEIRHSGMFLPEQQAIFNEKLSQCCSAGRWFCFFGTLSDANELDTRVRTMNLPAAGSEKADMLHAALERLTFEALRQGESWTRRLPHDDGLYRAIARGVWEGLESRQKIAGNGRVIGGANCAGGGSGGLIEGKLLMGPGLVIGHGVPKAKPGEGE